MSRSILQQLFGRLRSKLVFYVILVLSATMFAAFFFIGYDTPDEDAVRQTAPLMTTPLLIYMFCLFFATIGITAWSSFRYFRLRNAPAKKKKHASEERIRKLIMLSTAMLFAVGYLTGAADPLLINGKSYNDVLWLKISSMFTFVSIVMVIITISASIYSYYREHRKG